VATPEAAEGAVAGTAAAAGGAALSEPEVIKKGKADAAEAPAKK
jgi:hypothetical protein